MSLAAELVLRSDALEVVLLPELGGRIHRLRAFGTDLLRTPADPARHADDPFFWGAYVMAPWCNRVQAEPVRVAGRTVDLEPNFADGSAIHGQVFARPWRVRADGSLHVTGGDGDGWPWPYEVVAMVALDGPSLVLDYRLVNRSDGPMPAGLGLHPWFRRPVALSIPAEAVYRANTGSATDPEPVARAHDLRIARVPEADLDGTWTALGAPRIDLAWTQAGIAAGIEIGAEAAAGVLVAVATPGNLDAVAVEPQTHGPDGLRRLANGEPDAPAVLSPGAALRLTLRMTVERVSLPR
jgi:aldose 1-epimerase